ANEVLMDWYSGSAPYLVTPLDGINSKINKDVKLSYFADNENDKAINAASTADVVIVFGGNHPTGDAGWAKVARPSYGKESVDRETLNLEDEQWIRELYEVNQNIVMVLVSSFPYAINWSQHNLPAILQISHNSQEQGNALADVIFGDYNPAGRLVQSWPLSDSLLLPILDYNIRNGNTYLYSKNKPLYPFGFGLSYTKFEYSNLKINPLKDEALISFEVKNTGNYDGDEVVQIYVSHLNSQVTRPIKELKGFARKFIKKGETIKVAIPLKYKNLQYWDNELKKFVDEKNAIVIKVGTSSEDIRLKSTISID
ncbi:MAG: glycoside hydrolase family 3 C-terminal domain-containing protein, partial [Bacteroidales bacterium]|nr:glycoside hydrolase family 3 C-terminal domain-containing protein [Bacteroidales bacterium]